MITVVGGAVAAAVNRLTPVRFNAILMAILASLVTPIVGEAISKSSFFWYPALVIGSMAAHFMLVYGLMAYLLSGIKRQILDDPHRLDYSIPNRQRPAHR